MRTPNCSCVICGKPLYRRKYELSKIRYVACMEHRYIAQRKFGQTQAQKEALSLGSQKGTNHRKGYHHKDISKQKCSASHKIWCKNHPDLVIERGKKTRGINHYNWKGGSLRISAAIRAMTEYKKWMDSVKNRDGCCVVCKSEIDLEAHHIISLSDLIISLNIKSVDDIRTHADILWDITNGITLCKKCHCEKHNRKYTPNKKGYKYQPKHKRIYLKGQEHPKWSQVTKVCENCNDIFYVTPSVYNIRKCCSKECTNENRRKNISKNAITHPKII